MKKTNEKVVNLLVAGLLIALAVPASAASFKLDANGNAPFYQTKVSKEVYQYTHSSRLQDLTIQNASGEASALCANTL